MEHAARTYSTVQDLFRSFINNRPNKFKNIEVAREVARLGFKQCRREDIYFCRLGKLVNYPVQNKFCKIKKVSFDLISSPRHILYKGPKFLAINPIKKTMGTSQLLLLALLQFPSLSLKCLTLRERERDATQMTRKPSFKSRKTSRT